MHIIGVTKITAEAVIQMMGDYPYEGYDAGCICKNFGEQELSRPFGKSIFYEGTGWYRGCRTSAEYAGGWQSCPGIQGLPHS